MIEGKNIEISKGENITSVINNNIIKISKFETLVILSYYKYLSFF